MCSPLGSLGQITPQECDLSFHLSVTNTSNNVKFGGLTASEKGDTGDNTVGSTLTCSCSAVGLSPAKWLGPPGSAALNESFELTAGISYMLALDQPGTAVQLHTTNNAFTCAEAGYYTCVIGENRRQVLVLPVGKHVLNGDSCMQITKFTVSVAAYLHEGILFSIF